MSGSSSKIQERSSPPVETKRPASRRREQSDEVAHLYRVLRGYRTLSRYGLWRESGGHHWASVDNYERALEAAISQGCIRPLGSQLVKAVAPAEQAIPRSSTTVRRRRRPRRPIGGLAARVQQPSPGSYAVIDLSEGGMRLRGLNLPVGSLFEFRLVASGVDLSGRGRVAHRTGDTSGIAVDGWIGKADKVGSLVEIYRLPDRTGGERYVADWA